MRSIERIAMLLGILVCVCGLCACNGKKREVDNKDKEADLVYPAKNISAFCTDEEGNLYACDGETGSLCVFDKDGVQVEHVNIKPMEYHGLCYVDGVLYATASEFVGETELSGMCLVKLSMEDGSQTVLYENPNAWTSRRLAYGNGHLYFLVLEAMDLAEAALLSDPTGEYYYSGERLLGYSIESKEVKELSVERIVAFAKRDDTTLWVYAYDMDCGKYYYATYEPAADMMGEKGYVGDSANVLITTFAYDETEDKLLYADEFKSAVVAMEPGDLNSQSSFYQTEAGLSYDNELYCQDGCSYFLINGKVHRIKNSNYIKDYEPLRIYYSSHEYKIPEGTGFEINMVEVDEETMAMSMMAGDGDYDFLLLSTESPVAEQIRRVGAYEPLNKVPGVEKYLNESFAFIKEAATDDNGAVWMLPCDISCEVLVYNPELCLTYGIDFEKEYSNEALLKAQRVLEEAERNGNPSYYNYYFLRDRYRQMELYLADYAVVNGNACFNTELFRKYSKLYLDAKDQTGNEAFRYAWVSPGVPVYGATDEEVEEYYASYYSKVAFASMDKLNLALEYSSRIGGESYGILDYDFFRAKAMPSLEENKPAKNPASAFILVLNPKSVHLSEAKEFLSVLTERMNGEESIYRTRELEGEYSALEQKVHEIYSNSRIVYSYPDDVFWDEYLKYLNGEKVLDEVISELERKLNLYLKE